MRQLPGVAPRASAPRACGPGPPARPAARGGEDVIRSDAGGSFPALLAVRFRRLGARRLVRILALLAVAIAVACIIVAIRSRPPPAGELATAGTTFELTAVREVLLGIAAIFAILGLLIGATCIGAEWHAGTMATLLTWEPRHPRRSGEGCIVRGHRLPGGHRAPRSCSAASSPASPRLAERPSARTAPGSRTRSASPFGRGRRLRPCARRLRARLDRAEHRGRPRGRLRVLRLRGGAHPWPASSVAAVAPR